ncbi:non-ribosomal peptide synthetase [Aliikangiella coralliicola]|uniref:Amino acid adenylation domain-containing protein n=1 Tax=Aliikangiella coralliicola TaxID=2592383 RepID=A0A545U994_9GAMM|nr:non-ribosomal peptide synthetase [Aliikangiella coralliicola]TQV86009.1 amino acid adenylation domain-containing protein [Aliikangiella coralliicola]
MTINTLFKQLRAKKIKLWQENGELKFKAPKGALTGDIREQLINNKADIISFLQQLSTASQIPPILPLNRSEFDQLPLSFAQERLWFINQLEPDSASYNIPGAVSIKGVLDTQHVEKALKVIIARHDNLRTVFPSENGSARQLILDELNFELKVIDLSQEESSETREERAAQACLNDAVKPFNLATGPLIRSMVIKVEPEKHLFLLNMHHIISDGWSMGVLIYEFSLILDALREGRQVNLPALPIQYVDYSVWQKNWLEQSGILDRQLAYWQQKLTGVSETLNLATDFPRPNTLNFDGASQTFNLDAALTNSLKGLAEQQGCTLFMTLLAAFNVLLFRYTDQQDICVGSPIANRQYGETESLIGMFVNTLALRNQVSGDESFNAFLSTVKNTCLEAYEHQDTPFEKIVDLIQPKRNMAISPLFQVMLVLQNAPMQMLDDNVQVYPLDSGVSQFELTIEFTDTAEGLVGTVDYCTALYKPKTIERLITHFDTLCRVITEQPNAKIDALDYLKQSEKKRLLINYNESQTEYPQGKCIHQLFAEQVKRTPDNIAVVFNQQQLTYQQLYDKSAQLALYLQSQGVKPDSLVALCVERSLDMLIGLYGILLAGGAYVPLDPDYPDDRLAYMLKDCEADVVLTQQKLHDKLSAFVGEQTQLIKLDVQWSEICEVTTELMSRSIKLKQEVKPNHLAYVIYTSGSTGHPKGVMVEHRSMVNHNQYAIKQFGITEADTQIQFSSISFDLFVEEAFVILNQGARLILEQKNNLLTLDYLKGMIETYGVTTLNVPTAFFHQLAISGIDLGSVDKMIFGGEKLDHLKAGEFLRRYPHVSVHNTYGPTETTVISTSILVTQSVLEKYPNVPIGKPIANTQIFILDKNSNPQPVGVPGELHIAGDGLARGYLNRPELTEEKFVTNPFYIEPNDGIEKIASSETVAAKTSERMYKSGDLARWLDDGTIEYLGRIDNQVKIRGYRIEMEEIEAELIQHPVVKDCVVVAQGESGNQHLIAFYVAKDKNINGVKNHEQANSELRAHLQQRLPEYMLPTALVCLDKIPLTPNSKVDRRALESYQVTIESSQVYLAPRNETERQLVDIWADVLNLQSAKVGINDSFFEMGGHSLLATQLISKVRSKFDIELPLKALFENTSVAGFSQLIVNAEKSQIPAIKPVDKTQYDRLPLSFAQERLWFIDQLEPGSVGYNAAGALSIEGKLDVEELESAFNLIIERHDNLRTIFPSENGKAQQVILEKLEFKLDYLDLSEITDPKERDTRAKKYCLQEATKPFDLTKGPLIRGKVIKFSQQQHILLLNMHHIISDGWSLGVLLAELSSIMNAFALGQTPELPELPIQYVDYSVWQKNWLEQGGVLQQQLSYWRKKLAGVPESLDLATDFPRPSVQSFAGDSESFVLNSQLTRALSKLAESKGCTLYMALLAAVKTLLYRYTGQADICVGSPIANRQYGETEKLIGMFVNTLALRSQFDDKDNFNNILSKVKNTCLEAYEHQDTPFEKIVEVVQPKRNLAMSPLFQVMVILQNTEMEVLDQQIKPYELETSISNFDLTFEFTENADGLAATIEYSTALFKSQTIKRLVRHFSELCKAIIAQPENNLTELRYTDEVETQKLLKDFNHTQASYPKGKCLHDLFAEQVKREPEKIAVSFNQTELSYQQLFEKSTTLALYLQQQGVKPDNLIGLCVDRGPDMIVAMLGILQAGGAYVPLDPDYPDDRLSYILKDSQAKILLTQASLKERLSTFDGAQNRQLIELDQQWSDIEAEAARLTEQAIELKQTANENNLAYIIYTSGSTGQPKGVAIEHHSPVTLVHWGSEVYSQEELAGVLASTSICFDLSIYEIFLTLANGGKIILAPNALELPNLADKDSVTLINTVPSAMEELVRLNAIPDSVKTINLAGEPLLPTLVDKIYDNSQVSKVYDLYGPSEDTTYSTFILREKNAPQSIGRPIANTQVYLLDKHQNPQPIGVPGELHIAGDGLARGYLNQPALTDEKFIDNVFNPGTRLYKTGDLARWLDNGTLEYLGRIDTQVKIRGFRIEIGEIEAQLNSHPKIKESVVVAQGESGSKQLVGFYVVEDVNQAMTNDDLKVYLQQSLPEYMIPATFVVLDSIPLTQNGKINRRALENEKVSFESSRDYLAPRNEMEKQLVEIWAEILNLQVEKIGVNDNFFELGGHSLLATQLVAKIREQLVVDLPLKTLFDVYSLADSADAIKAIKEQSEQMLDVKVDESELEEVSL